MKKRTKIWLTVILIVAVILAGGVMTLSLIRQKNMEAGSSKLTARRPAINDEPNFINVAIYPYVPNQGYMEKLCAEMFKKIAPDVTLNFVDWDCYINNTPNDIDVFMYDALSLETLYENGYLSELDLADYDGMDDIMPFALEDTLIDVDGEKKTFCIPNLLCSSFLIYYDGDEEVENANNIDELYDVIGDTNGFFRPPKNRGLITNFSFNYAYFYMEALEDAEDPENRDIFAHKDQLVPEAVESVSKLAKMCGKSQVRESALLTWLRGTFAKAEWFRDGYGRALYGDSEAMSKLGDKVKDVNIRLISMGKGENNPEFYADLLSINTSVTDPRKKENCRKLVDMLASHDYIYEVSLNDGSPAYLLPARESMYDELAQKYPMYREIKDELDRWDKHVRRYGSWFYDFINHVFDTLMDAIDM